jgi:hypothetical protein
MGENGLVSEWYPLMVFLNFSDFMFCTDFNALAPRDFRFSWQLASSAQEIYLRTPEGVSALDGLWI